MADFDKDDSYYENSRQWRRDEDDNCNFSSQLRNRKMRLLTAICNLFWSIVDCFVATASNDPEMYMEEGDKQCQTK